MPGLKEWLRPYYLRWLYFPLFPSARPTYFEDTWRFPATPVTQLPPNFLAHPTAHPDFLFLPMTDWHTRLQRSQHLATALAGLGHRCLYLNPHLGREYRRPYQWNESPLLTRLAATIAELHIHLPREPVYHSRLLYPSEIQRIVKGLRDTLAALQVKSIVQIVSLPVWLRIAQQLRAEFGYPILYDCHDRLSGFRNIAPEIVALEDQLFAECDLALISSQHLRDSITGRNPDLAAKSILLRNGVQSDNFPPAAASPADPPTVGYMGALDHWFDVEALALAAARHPEWRFVLIGRVEHPGVLTLQRFSNVQFLGEIPHSRLAAHASTFRIGLIPFLRNELTLATNPIKLYEYFSMGLPVVSTNLPEVARYQDLVYLADTATFTARMEDAMSETGTALRTRRQAIATQESWTARARALAGVAAQSLESIHRMSSR